MGERVNRALSTFFGIGYLPVMPGTYASLAGLLIYLCLKNNLYAYLAVTLLLTVTGFIVSRRAEELFGSQDPNEVVIDEVSGMLVAYLFVPFSVNAVVAGFLIFRLVDIVKVFPINLLERIKGGTGIMIDDVVGGIMTNIILQIIFRIIL